LLNEPTVAYRKKNYYHFAANFIDEFASMKARRVHL